jgi:type 1 glutamine amidotransferase
MARALKRIGAILLILILLLSMAALWLIGPGNAERMFLGLGITYDTDAPRLPELKQPAILIFSKTNGFRDDAQINAANAALEKLAHDQGWSSYTTENAAIFNARQLWQFKTVVWNSVSGDVLTAEQRATFKRWLEEGHGYVGLHGSGGDPSYQWRWYVDDLIGAQFIGHTLSPHIQRGRLVVEDRTHPATRGLGDVWLRDDEWYSFDKSPRAKGYHILISLDEASYSPRERIPLLVDKDLRMGKDHPMVWAHCVGKGRAFYSALGHQAQSYSEPKHLEMIAGAISWAARLDGSGCEDADVK